MKSLENLINPRSKEKLDLDWVKGVINRLDQEVYYGEIKDGIPIILPRMKNEIKKLTSFHINLNSEFDYIEHYKKDAEYFDYFLDIDNITESERSRLNQKIYSLINKNSKSILDVGCGNGWLSKMMQNDHNNIVSLDISFINVKKTLMNQSHPNHSGIVADVFHLPFPDDTFDTIIASEIMEHIYDPIKFIECLFQVLKPGGQLIISTPYNERIPLSLCVHCNKPTPRDAHLHTFNKENIKGFIPSVVKKWQTKTISNQYLLKTRITFLLRKIPFIVWEAIDSIANKIFKNPTRLVLKILK